MNTQYDIKNKSNIEFFKKFDFKDINIQLCSFIFLSTQLLILTFY